MANDSDDDPLSYTPERPPPGRRRRRSMSSDREDVPKRSKLSTAVTTEDLLKIISSFQNAPSKISTNVIPEFDPNNKSQGVERWLKKVNECVLIYNWDERQTIHFALQKLSGLAKKWYEAQPSLNKTWAEWQSKLLKAFPNDTNYGKLLEEMLQRKSRPEETLREYFYDKLALLTRCEMEGRKAVDCIIYGIGDHSVRSGAQALKCKEPEDLLDYLASQQPTSIILKETARSYSYPKRREFRPNQNKSFNGSLGRNTEISCFNCQERGHTYQNCSKPLIKCSKCNRVGHNLETCSKRPLQARYVGNSTPTTSQTTEKVLKVVSDGRDCNVDRFHLDIQQSSFTRKVNISTNTKFNKDAFVNGIVMLAFIDFGSDCSLIRNSDAAMLNLVGSEKDLPVIKGFGDSVVKPRFRTNVHIKIDEIETDLSLYIVEDYLLTTPLLIGQNFTELPMVTVLKNEESLFFYHTPQHDIITQSHDTMNLYTKETCNIVKGGLVDVYTNRSYTGDIYVSGGTRLTPDQEYHLHQGCYKVIEGKCLVFITSFSSNPINIKADTLIARAKPVSENRVYIVDSNETTRKTPINREDLTVGQSLDETNRKRLHQLLQKYRHCFAMDLKELGCAKGVEMNIELLDKAPVIYRPYKLSYQERQTVRGIVEDLLENEIVQESDSNYASPILLVRKKNGESRLCVDYRSLNNKTLKDKYPLPLIDDQLSNLSGNHFFTTLDLASGYYQISMGKESRNLTAFVTPDGHYEFKRMPFGLANAPAVFQKAMNKILGPRRFSSALAYMDDLLIPSATIEEGFSRLEDVLLVLEEAGLTLNLKKCSFFDTQFEYLGYEISAEGIKPSERKILAVRDFPTPLNVHQVRQFLGLASYFRRFIKGFGEIARPLTGLLKKDMPWKWQEEQDISFSSLKSLLVERPLLALYNPNLDTELHTDASSLGFGGILLQWQTSPRILKPVAYFSRQTTPEERFLHSYELETLAVVCSLKKFRSYLLGLNFIVYTDCNALRTTLTKRDLIPRIARWWLQISEFNFTIDYRPGCRMGHVDALSRNPAKIDELVDSVNILNISTDNWLLTLQLADTEMDRIFKILNHNQDPEVSAVKKEYIIKNHALHRKVGEQTLLAVPKSARWQICRANHDDMGHFGYAKTLERIQSRYWFPKLRRFVKKYVAACIECAYNKDNTSKTRTGYLHPIEKVEQPFHTLHLDHLGPFIKSKNKNNYILTIVDGFTKYLFARPARDTKTKSVVKILDSLFSDFGVPIRIITDRGTAFTSAKFKEFCTSKGIKHILNAVACPRANGQAERFNQTILTALSTQNFEKDERDWDKQLGQVQWGINNTVNATTKKSASELLFGIKFNSATDNKLTVDNSTNNEAEGLSNLRKTRLDASLNIKNSQNRQKAAYDANRSPSVSYSVGDLVKITKTSFANDGRSKKLLPKFIGPFKIVKSLGNDRYEIANVPGFDSRKYETVVAADRMRPWINVQALEIDTSSETSPSETDADTD